MTQSQVKIISICPTGYVCITGSYNCLYITGLVKSWLGVMEFHYNTCLTLQAMLKQSSELSEEHPEHYLRTQGQNQRSDLVLNMTFSTICQQHLGQFRTSSSLWLQRPSLDKKKLSTACRVKAIFQFPPNILK